MLKTKRKNSANLIEKMQKIVGRENVLSSDEELFVYSTDATNLTEIKDLADVVVFVETTEQVSEIMKYAFSKKIPVTARSAGTNLCGACLPKRGGIVLNFSKMNKILEINKQNLTCKVHPGVVVEDLQNAVKELNLFYPPDPSNLKVSMIGGSIGLSSGGPHTFKYGTTKDYVVGLTVVLADGRIMQTGSDCAKDVTGYNTTQLFVGAEGTLGIVTQATLRLIPKPESTKVLLAYFDDLKDTATTANEIISRLITPSVIDLMDKNTLRTIQDFCPCGLQTDKVAALLIEIDGFADGLEKQYNKIIDICRENNASFIQTASTKEEEEKIWFARRASFGATAKLAPNVLTEDVVVPRENIVALVEGIQNICDKYQLKTCIMGHIGDGNIHPNIAIDMRNPNEVYNFNLAKNELFNLALSLNGRLSGEHGIGCEKSSYMRRAIEPNNYEYMKHIKELFDPKNILNPDKIF